MGPALTCPICLNGSRQVHHRRPYASAEMAGHALLLSGPSVTLAQNAIQCQMTSRRGMSHELRRSRLSSVHVHRILFRRWPAAQGMSRGSQSAFIDSHHDCSFVNRQQPLIVRSKPECGQRSLGTTRFRMGRKAQYGVRDSLDGKGRITEENAWLGRSTIPSLLHQRPPSLNIRTPHHMQMTMVAYSTSHECHNELTLCETSVSLHGGSKTEK